MFALIAKLTLLVCDKLKLSATRPLAVSVPEALIWLEPLFGHTMNWPPDAAESLWTAKGEKLL